MGPARNPEIDLMLEIFLMVREPGRRYTQQEIADVLGCSRARVYQIEKAAIKKMRMAARRISHNQI